MTLAKIMTLESAPWNELPDREERLVARIAAIARVDTIWGGARALVIANRLQRLGGTDLRYVVSDVYRASTGKRHGRHEAWECPECGCARLGQESAWECCADDQEVA